MLTLMTVNLDYRADTYGPWEQRKQALLALIAVKRPHIVALQAVDASGSTHSQAQELAEGTGYLTAVFAAANLETRQGSAFLLDRPVLQIEVQPIERSPEDSDYTARILLAARVTLNPSGASGWFVNGHFSWVPDQNARHLAQARAFALKLGGMVALMGDFNAGPDRPGPQQLTQQGWVDCWSWCHPQDPGFTFSSDRPAQRIDYIWIDPERVQIQDTEVTPGNGLALSDHLAVIARLST